MQRSPHWACCSSHRIIGASPGPVGWGIGPQAFMHSGGGGESLVCARDGANEQAVSIRVAIATRARSAGNDLLILGRLGQMTGCSLGVACGRGGNAPGCGFELLTSSVKCTRGRGEIAAKAHQLDTGSTASGQLIATPATQASAQHEAQ